MSTTHEFTMDPNLLISVIKSQAGSLCKALLEGVMNSIDAGASQVDLTLTSTEFTIFDNGKGFSSEEEIREWFGRFGTPHKEGDAIYGRFRMGRGMMMSFASTVWKSNKFQMSVDIDNKGMGYDLVTDAEVQKGCLIKGSLYEPLERWSLSDTLTELKKAVAYALKPVYVNGELYGAPASRLKSWTFEDEDAYYRVGQGDQQLAVYNQGVFVEEMGTWRIGLGGVVVSKGPLEVNFARNSVMEARCPRWKRIAARMESLVLEKLASAKKLEEGERSFLARRLTKLRDNGDSAWLKAKVLTDPSGKHLAVSDLRNFRRFTLVRDNEALGCAVQGEQGLFVVTESVLNRFGCAELSDWLRVMENLGAINLDYEVLEEEDLTKHGLGSAEVLLPGNLSRSEQAAVATLEKLNTALAAILVSTGKAYGRRGIRVGRHKNKFVAWTDGKDYITVNKRYLKMFERGLDGTLEWLQTLVHEYTHDTDDSESHSHGEVFYRKFHDTMFSSCCLNLASLAHTGTSEYLHQLNKHGLPKPHSITRQLKPLSADETEKALQGWIPQFSS